MPHASFCDLMPVMPDGFTVLFIILGVAMLLPLLDVLITGGVILKGAWRFVRCKIRGSKLVDWPQDLKVAAANGLVGIGSELVVGGPAQWDGARVKRYSIAAADCGEQPGAVLKVIGTGRNKIEVVPLK